MPAFETRTTLTEASGGNDLTAFTPQILPGIIPLRFRRLVVADLMPSGTADGNLIRYMKEATFTNAAATVAEAGTKPESAITFTHVDEVFHKIAHTIPVTDEMLEDVAAIRSFIDARMILGVQLTEEDQLLNGDGTGSNLTGLLNRSGLNTATARGTDTNMDAVFKQITSIFTNAFYNVDGVVMNPANWQTIQLLKNAQGNYYGQGPFVGPQGGVFGQGGPSLWGTRVIITPQIASGTALVGAFGEAAQVYRKGGIQLAATNSHASEFINNITRIRAEERLALAVYRPGAFGTVTGLN
jgi:HK97 family phage major capsid protein